MRSYILVSTAQPRSCPRSCIAISNFANGIRVLTHGKCKWGTHIANDEKTYKVIETCVLEECIKHYKSREDQNEYLHLFWPENDYDKLKQKHDSIIMKCIYLFEKMKGNVDSWIVLPGDTGHSVSWIESLEREKEGTCVESGSSGTKIKRFNLKKADFPKELHHEKNNNLKAVKDLKREEFDKLLEELKGKLKTQVTVYVTGGTNGNVQLGENGVRKFVDLERNETFQVDGFVPLSQTDEGKYESMQARHVLQELGVFVPPPDSYVAGIGGQTFQVCDGNNTLIPEWSGLVTHLGTTT